jgi:NAD(P)-dependent dehydrogenase (short-subunit alcohol dehydrogenase family)
MPLLAGPPSFDRMTDTQVANGHGTPRAARVAVVTGASRGLGRALARALAEDGYRLVVDARNGDALRAAMAGLPAGAVVSALAGDITDPAHRGDLRRAADTLGGANLLINNAGTLGPSPLPAVADFPLDKLRTALEVNVLAPIALTQLLLPALRERGGAVLSITSDAAVEAYAGWGGYGAAKAALEQACNVLAAEEVAVRVWRVDPGDLRTQMHQDAFPGEDISDRPLPESVVPAFRRLIRERMPSGRYRAADLMPAGDQAAADPAGADPAASGPAASGPAASGPAAGDREGAAPGAEPVLGGPGRS